MAVYPWKRASVFVLILYLTLIMFFSACGRRLDHSVQNLSELFRENETMFREAAEILNENGSDSLILILPPDSTEKQLDVVNRMIIKEMDGSIIAATNELTAEEYGEITRTVTPLFSDLHIESISKARMSVRFTIESTSGLTANIVYAPDVDESRINLGFEITEILEIEPCWYGALTSD